MKKHAIIPVFIPHKGCGNECVFCNQRRITARSAPVMPSDVDDIVEEYMSTLSFMDMEEIELSFFGGSFTGIPLDEQKAFLEVAKKYKEQGTIQRIHLSTRPDYIDERILDNLKSFGVDTIELGVQSFSQPVLDASKRGHSVESVYRSCHMIKDYGFILGIQLMVGLPEDSMEQDIFSAHQTVALAPSIARLYPTVVIPDTELYDMFLSGKYIPMEQDDAVRRTAAMYRILDDAGINIIRVGLKSSDIINGENLPSGTFHPAFRQLVEGTIAREDLDSMLSKCNPGTHVHCVCHPDSLNSMIGHKAVNRKYFSKTYPWLHISYTTDMTMKKGSYKIIT